MSTYRFDDFELDADDFRLVRNGSIVAAEPLVIDLLLLFVRNPGRLLTRDELVEKIWKGRFVADTTISTAVKSLRRVLGDSGATQKFIKTVHGRGFQFVAGVTCAETTTVATSVTRMQPTLIFNVSVFEDALSETETRTLANRLRTTFNRVPVLRIALPPHDGDVAHDVRNLFASYGITHVADVTVTKTGGQFEADVALIETKSGIQTWSRAIRAEADSDGHAVLLVRIVAHLEPAIMQAMIDMFSEAKGPRHPQALVIQAVGTLANRGWNRDSFETAKPLLDEAIAGDDGIAIAHAYAALVRALGHRIGARPVPEEKTEAIRYAEQALALEARDSLVIGIAGCALCDVGQLDRGLPVLRKSADLDPTNGHALAAIGGALIMKKDFEGASEMLRRGIVISPADSRLAVWEALLAMSEMLCGRYDGALAVAQSAVSRDDHNYLSRLALAGALVANGQLDDLAPAVVELLRVHPDLTESEVVHFVGPDLTVPIWQTVGALRAET